MARGEINTVLGMTEGKFRTMIKSALRPCWRNSSRKTFIQSVRQRGINPATGRERFVVVCVDCGKEMGISEKERRTKIDGTLEKRAKSVYEIDHVDGITPSETDGYGVGRSCLPASTSQSRGSQA